jgi:hypothetical protein
MVETIVVSISDKNNPIAMLGSHLVSPYGT